MISYETSQTIRGSLVVARANRSLSDRACKRRDKRREAKKRAETRFEYTRMTETIGAGLKALWAPTGPPGLLPLPSPNSPLLLLLLILGSVGPSDSCPVFIALLCSSPTARPFAHTSHHNVSFFLVPGPVRVMGPLHGHLEGSFFTRDVLPEAHLPVPIPLISAPRSWHYTIRRIRLSNPNLIRLFQLLS